MSINETFELSESALNGLKEAAQRGTLVPFIGAGASILAGAPSWSGFADEVLKQFITTGKFSHAQLDQLSGLSPRIKLSIGLGLEKKHGQAINHEAIFKKQETNSKGNSLYSDLSRLGRSFVTTNYDEWLDESLILPSMKEAGSNGKEISPVSIKRRVVHKTEEFTSANLNHPDSVIHLHGSIQDPEGMIYTTQQYVKHYANDHRVDDPEKENRVLTFLESLFKEKTVVFIGYGLEELEILEYVILKARRMPGTDRHEIKHYLVQGFFSHQRLLMESMKQYYQDECGIELIPFLRDEKDWDALLDVVGELAEKVPCRELMRLQEFKEMEGLLDG
ncbi:MAG: SIR2 family protein [Gimesia sp.]